MMSLPLPVRLAAGLVATAVEQARELPRLVVEFPVSAVSQALQVSMRMQQRVTELAIKGDRALGSLRPVEEEPAWATFDEDRPRDVQARNVQARNGSTVTELHPQPPHPQPPPPPRTVTPIQVQHTAPAALPMYPELSIPQLRAKLRTLTVADLRALLAFEQAHENRPPYVTMLTNRITTVTAE